MQNSETKAVSEREVSAGLIIGIVLMPFVFAWFTLRKGYSSLARIGAFGWLIGLYSLGILFPVSDDKVTEPAKNMAAKSAPVETVRESVQKTSNESPMHSQATSVVTAMCHSLASPLNPEISMSAMETMFGESKVSEWCGCTYDAVSKNFTDEQIANSPTAGLIDETAQSLRKSVARSAASCIESSHVPESGKDLRDAFVNVLRVSAN